MKLMIYGGLVLGFFGACMGSFVGALVWRLKTGRNWVSERSECEHCHHQLSAWDLIPIISWLWLKGKCRYCHRSIGWSAFLLEVSTAALFVALFVWWPFPLVMWYQWLDLGLWLVFVVFLVALFVYDLRWFILPDKLTYPLMALGLLDGLLRTMWMQRLDGLGVVVTLGLGLLPIAGFYGVLYFVSRGRWVGLGDAKLGVFIGLVLGWEGALLTLIFANFIGTLVVLPGLLSKRLTRRSRVPFGPFLIVAFVIVGLFGARLIDWYLTTYLLVG